jgi:hypothetical protein
MTGVEARPRSLRFAPVSPVAQASPESERRLWKLTSDVVSTEHRWSEYLIFCLFAILAAVATIHCFFQLFRLLNDESISHMVKILLQ